MPLRDHFRPLLDLITSWEGFHGQWPAVIVQHLRKQIPTGYVAEPRVHSWSQVEIDVAAFEKDDAPPSSTMTEGNGGVPTAVWAPAQPSVAVETTCRWTRQGKRTLLEAWSHVLTLEEPLPTLPPWLSSDLVVPLNPEQCYEQACSDLWIA
jgi:hypothetical protein